MACCGWKSPQACCCSLLLLTSLLLLFHQTLGNLECEELPVEDCAFAVASNGARCVLEKQYTRQSGKVDYKCQTSMILAERPLEWIETDECINSCGLKRLSVGLSSDALLEPRFLQGICSNRCVGNCPNIIDIYTKLAAEEGIHLPNLCDSLDATTSHRIQIGGAFVEPQPTFKLNTRTMKKLYAQNENTRDIAIWPSFVESPYPHPFPHVEPPYPYRHHRNPHPHDRYSYPHHPEVEAPLPFPYLEPPYPYPYPKVEAPLPFPYPHPYAEPPNSNPYIEPPYPYEEPPHSSSMPPTSVEPPYNGEPQYPYAPMYSQPEPTLVAPSLPPSIYYNGI